MSAVYEAARGRWTGILPALGISVKSLTGKNAPCPMCGGKDRFRFLNSEGNGTWVCNQCGAGNGITLLRQFKGWDFHTTAVEVEAIIGEVRVEQPKRERSEAAKRADMNRLWQAGAMVTPSDPVGLYLSRRVGLASFPRALRYVERMAYHDEAASEHPGMIAMVTGPDGKPATLHRTYLTPDGRKASVAAPRRLMPGALPKGSTVRLFDAGFEMGVAEGIETALAAASMFCMPVWAALNASNLEGWTPPAGAERIVVFGDHDLSFTGQDVAFGLARRLKTAGFDTRVEIPSAPGQDWNDVLLHQGEAA